MTSCYSNWSERPHRRSRTDTSIALARWRQCVLTSKTWFLWPHESVPSSISIGLATSARFIPHATLPNSMLYHFSGPNTSQTARPFKWGSSSNNDSAGPHEFTAQSGSLAVQPFRGVIHMLNIHTYIHTDRQTDRHRDHRTCDIV